MSTAAADSDPDQTARSRLREIIERESLLSGGEFRLASGAASSFFFDMKKTMFDPEGADLMADAVLDILEDLDAEFVGGLEMGAVPLVAQVCLKSRARPRPVRGFFVRKEIKDHGTQKRIDGHLEADANVVLLEDVTTTGGSVLKAVRAVRERGCTVVKVITMVDRLEGARENLAKEGIELAALFTREDFAG